MSQPKKCVAIQFEITYSPNPFHSDCYETAIIEDDKWLFVAGDETALKSINHLCKMLHLPKHVKITIKK